jgi:hypothetical protein
MLFKKNSKLLIGFLLTFLLILINQEKLHAEALCSDWDNAVSKNWQLHEPYHENRNDIGIFYDFKWDNINKNIIIKRNNKNYPVVRFSLFNNKDIPQGSVISFYNKIDLSKKNDRQVEDLFKQNKTANLKIDNNISISINPKNYKLNDIKMNSFGLQTIQSIEATKGIIEISFFSSFSNKRPDLLKILKKEGVYEENSYDTLCDQTINNNNFPIENFYFSEFKYDEDVRQGLNNKAKLNVPILAMSTDRGMLRIFRYESGVSFYRQDFQFHKFPFDKQKISIQILSNKRTTDDPSLEINNDGSVVTFITPEKGAFLNLDKFKLDNNYLKEWEIINTNIKSIAKINEEYYDVYSGKTVKDIENILEIEIEIERNFEQYIFKIIIPVFLILSLAWFVLWIPTREFETRLTTSMVALLSLIAYNFVFVDDVPKLKYLTALDEYILLSYIFCCIPTFMSIWFSRFISTNQKKATLINRNIRVWGIAFYVISSMWIFFPK